MKLEHTCSGCGNPTHNEEDIGGVKVHICNKCQLAIQKQIEFQSDNQHFRKDKIKCPWCDFEYEDYDGYAYDAGAEEEVECAECGKKFELQVEEIRYYSTKKAVSEMPSDYSGEEDDNE